MGQAAATFPEPRSSTQMMGQVEPAFAEPRSATQAMGQVAPAFAEPRSSTQMMGQVEPAFTEPRSSTQMMGQVEPAFAEPRSSTQMMGQVEPAFAEPRSSTQVMGQVAAPFPEQRSSTQMMGQVAAPLPESRSSTLIMGDVGATSGSGASGLLDVDLREEPLVPMVGLLEAPLASGRSATPLMGVPGPARRSTLSFGTLGEGEAVSGPRPTAEMGLVLPADPEGRAPPFPLGLQGHAAGAQSARIGGPSQAGPGRMKWIVGAALLTVVGLVGWRSLEGRRELPESALTAHGDALTAIRRDDPASLTLASEQLSALLRQHPTFVRASADQGLVLALQLDDQKARADAQHAAQAGLRMQIEALERARSPGDWQNRVNALRDALSGHDRTLAEILSVETRLQQELLMVRDALPKPSQLTETEDRIAVTRAHLFAEAVAGSTESLGLLARFQQEGGSDAWQKIAYATYILNSRGAQASGLAQAREGLADVKSADAVWLRPYVLSARLARSAADAQGVRSNLDAVLTLNPKHAIAAELRELLAAE